MKNETKSTVTSTELAQQTCAAAIAASERADVKLPKRSISQMIGASLSLLVAAQIFVACQPNSGPGGAPTPTTKPGDHLGGNGTGDSAGGDGINNKVFEKYAVPDIRKTPEWITYIEPIEKHLASLPKLQNIDANNLLSTLARTKRWYIAPISLDQIEKATLGVEFIKDPIQQLALQTEKAIWIDENRYKMSTDSDPKKNNTDLDRATLLMHEAMVSLYLIRFMPAEEVCRLFTEDPKGCDSQVVNVMIGPPEPGRKLEKLDYERIRTMTAWMMNNAINSTSQREVFIELYRHSFDPRFFKADPEAPRRVDLEGGGSASYHEESAVDVELGAQAQFVAGAKTLGRMPLNCAIDMPGFVNGVCDVNVELTTVPNVSRMLKMTFKIQTNGAVQEFVAYQLTGTEPYKSKMYPQPSIMNRDEALFSQYVGSAFPAGLEVLSVGQDFYEVHIGWAKDMQTIKEITLQQRRVTGVTGTKTTDYRGYTGTENTISYGTPVDGERRDILITSENEQLAKKTFKVPGSSANTNYIVILNPQPTASTP